MPKKNVNIIDSPPSEPDDDFWIEQGRGLVKGSLSALLDASKSLMTGLGMLQGIYLGILGFAEYVPKTMPNIFKFLFALPFLFWLFALYKCLQILMTKKFKLHLNSPDEIRETYENILKDKQEKLTQAFWTLASGLIMAVLLFGFRLKI